MKRHLFYVCLFFFAATCLVTLLGVVRVIPISETILEKLVFGSVIALSGGVIALLKQKDFLSEPVGVHLVPSSAPSEVKNHEDKRRPEIEDKFMVHASKSSYPSYPGIYSFKVTFSLSDQRVQYHVDELISAGLLEAHSIKNSQEQSFSLTPKGRKYLMNKGLLE